MTNQEISKLFIRFYEKLYDEELTVENLHHIQNLLKRAQASVDLIRGTKETNDKIRKQQEEIFERTFPKIVQGSQKGS